MKLRRIIITYISLIALFCLMISGCSQNVNNNEGNYSDEKVIETYLDNKIWTPSFKNGKIFTSHKLLGEDTDHIYLWVYLREFNGYKSGTLPIVLNVKRENNSLQIISHQIPRDGALHRPDILTLFPKDLQDQASNLSKEDLDRMQKETEQRADEWFQKH